MRPRSVVEIEEDVTAIEDQDSWMEINDDDIDPYYSIPVDNSNLFRYD